MEGKPKKVRVNNTDWPYEYAPPPRPIDAIGCPYCYGPIFFSTDDYDKHWYTSHVAPVKDVNA